MRFPASKKYGRKSSNKLFTNFNEWHCGTAASVAVVACHGESAADVSPQNVRLSISFICQRQNEQTNEHTKALAGPQLD